MTNSDSLEPEATVYPWFAVMVKTRHEKAVANSLRSKGYTELLPLYDSFRVIGGRRKTARLPLFPNYVFSRFNPHDRLPILSTPGVFGIVGTRSAPVPVEEHEIASIRLILDGGQTVGPWPYIKAGDKVRIDRGPLKGVQGILLSADKPRLLVSVTILQRTVAVEIEHEWIGPAGPPPALHNLHCHTRSGDWRMPGCFPPNSTPCPE